MKSYNRVISVLASPACALVLIACAAAFFVSEKTALFRLEPASTREVFFSLPGRVLATCFLVWASSSLLSSRGGAGKASVLVKAGVVVAVAGLWVSFFTRFEGSVVLMEGQSFAPFKSNFIPSSLYMRRYAKVPQVGLTVRKIVPLTGADPGRLKRVTSDIMYAGDTTGGVLEKTVDSRWPLISDWTVIRMSDFGYAANFTISGPDGQPIDGDWVYTKTFPPGSEDFFTSFLFGYIFHIRCYPDYIDTGKRPGAKGAAIGKPVFNVRIVRNKDIVYNGLLTPQEHLKFDNLIFQIPRVRHWVKFTFVRDFGVPVSAIGFLLMLTGGTALLINCRRNERNNK